MELTTLKDLLSDPTKLIEKVQALRPEDNDVFEDIQPENHDVMDEQKRKKREVKYDSDEEDPITREPKIKTDYEEVTRIPSAIEKTIIEWSVQMAAGVPVDPQAKTKDTTEEVMFGMVKHILNANKIDFIDKEVLRLMGTYKRVAEVWYSEPASEGYWGELGNFPTRMRVMLMSYETGDILLPLFDRIGDFIALTREYKVKDDEGKDIDMFDVFMADKRITLTKGESGWASEDVTNKYGKLNGIYYSQDRTEYADIIQKRKRLEILQSDIGDQNLATGSPIIVASKLKGLGKRGETGKVFETEDGGDVKILEAAGAPESLKLEWDNLKKDIYAETRTPDTSIFDAQSMGANVPGITIKLRFLPATLKALSKQTGAWGMGIQRRYNFLKSACTVINPQVKAAIGLQITPKFGLYLPSNQTEEYDNIVKLVTAGLMSKQTAIAALKFTDDPEVEYTKIQEEAKAAAALVPKVEVPVLA